MDYRDLKAGQIKENFWFKAKNDLVEILMSKLCKDKKQINILNVGPGTGDDLQILNKFGENYIIDINKSALSLINNKLYKDKKIADACNIPYKNSFFDVAVCFDVFEHIQDDKKAAGEIYRVLKEGGILIFSVPAFQFLFSSHDKFMGHYRRYNVRNIKKLLSEFRNLKILSWNSLLFAPIAARRILKKNNEPEIDKTDLPLWIDNTFYRLLSIDNFLIKKNFSLPIGLSIVGFCCKKTNGKQ